MEIAIKNLQRKIPVNPKRIRAAVLEALPRGALEKSGEITVCFVSGKKIKSLNRQFLGKYSATDVLSFELADAKSGFIADVAVSTDAALRNSRRYGTSLLFELCLYVVHGILHLFGYDDRTEKQRLHMEKKAVIILQRLPFIRSQNKK